MARRARPVATIAATLVVATLTPAARAEGAEERMIDLAWEAPAGCPSADAMRGEIDELLGSGASPRTRASLWARATVEHGERWQVTLETRVGAAAGHRTIEATSCQDLASATALILALMIDPDAVAAHQGKAKVGAAAAPPPPAPPAPSLPTAPAPPASPPAAATRATFGIAGLGAAANVGVLPGPDVGAGATLGLVRGRWRLDLRGAVGLRAVPSDALAQPAGARGKFRFHAGTLAGCYLWPGARVAIGPCLAAEVGLVQGAGTGTSHDRAETTPWLALGGGGALVVEVTASLRLPLRLEVLAPLWRPRYTVSNTDATLFRSAPLGGRLTAGVEWRF